MTLEKKTMSYTEVSKTEISRRYEFIVNTSKELMSLVNRNYEYEAVNDEHCRARNLARDSIIGRTIAELWDENVFQQSIKKPLDLCFEGETTNYRAHYEHAVKGVRYMDVTYYPYYDADQIVTHAVVVQRDITEQERAEQAIRRYARRLETLHEVDRGILAAQSPEEVAEAALEQLQYLIPFQQASIVMLEGTYLSESQLSISEQPELHSSGESLLDVSGVNKASGASSTHRRTNNLPSHNSSPRVGNEGNTRLAPDVDYPFERHGQLFDIQKTRVLALLQVDSAERAHSENEVNHFDAADESVDEGNGDAPLSFINIPLIAQGELLGSLNLGSYHESSFTAEHGDIAREVASQVALAVQQSQLREVLRRYNNELEIMVQARTQEIERRRQVAEGMQDILSILNSNRPVDEVLNYILTQARTLFKTDWVTFFGAPESDAELDLLSLHSLHTDSLSSDELMVSYRLTQQVISTGQPVEITKVFFHRRSESLYHTQQHELWADVDLNQVRYESILAVPLSSNDAIYGCIVLYSVQDREYTNDDVNTATSLANQAALAIENALLHQQAEQLAVMEERERLARDLHDSVTQSIYSLTLFSEAGQRVMRTGDNQRAISYLEQLGITASQALKEMRLLLYELRPVVLEQEGLIGALRRRLEAVEKRAGVQIQYDVSEPLVLPWSIEEGLYRVAQEALNNSLKHSGADLVKVRIQRNTQFVMVEITDNGQGFFISEAKNSGGMGLLNMRERMQRLNGTLNIWSEPSKGTTITARIDTDDDFDRFIGVSQHNLIEADGGK